MAELTPAPFADLVDQLHLEYERQGSIFSFPKRKWYIPDAAGPDLSVRYHGHPAANPLGPAAGPHTQMAQNLVLAWLAGARILELKTVQINDRIQIPRPCIDAANVCYNVEWSQELRLADSLREYVAGAMMIHMLRAGDFFDGVDLSGPPGDTIYELSVGYDLAGIRSEPIRSFIESMKDAGDTIDRLRLQIPARYRHLRDLDYPAHLSSSVTLSTFHGCPPDEIERICEFLLTELDLDVVVKMNPVMLGRQPLEHLLHDVLGYSEITVNPKAYASGLPFDEAVQMSERLTRLARKHHRHFGVKFCNTLEVLNHRRIFAPDHEVMYLSGPPLHVIALTLAEQFCRAAGLDLPLSFSGGVDRHSFADMVACGFCPVTTCTDLLRPGGYGRLPKYLEALSERMRELGVHTIPEYVRAACGLPGAAANLAAIAEKARHNDRYRAERNRAIPKQIDSHLTLFDCIACDKCVHVCPDAANFVYEIAPQQIEFHDWIVQADGRLSPGPQQTLVIQCRHQIANFADFCNQCGNCDTFCPEHGAPYLAKPTFFSSREAWSRHEARDGFYISVSPRGRDIFGRLDGRPYTLTHDTPTGEYIFNDGVLEMRFHNLTGPLRDLTGPPVLSAGSPAAPVGRRIDMRAFHTLRLLLYALLDPRRIHPVNAAILASNAPPPR